MANDAKALADILVRITHQPASTSDTHLLSRESRALASVLIQALRRHSASDIAAWIRWRLRTSERPDKRPVKSLAPNELSTQLEDVRRVRKVAKKRKRHQSQLDPYRAELLALKEAGASWSELRDWLRRYARIKVDRSTVIRRVTLWSGHGED